jgi:cysteinyl-tRNA synthetase
VTQVVFVPDLDSRTIQGSCEAHMELAGYTQRQFDAILNDLDQLGVQRAHRYPRTSEHVDAIIEFSKVLLNKGVAYEKLRSVYFNVAQSHDYGALSKINIKKIRLGTTVDLDAYEKLNPRDFTLLKRTTLAELKRGIFIKTDWGNVLPSWHIAAAAVAAKQLGSTADIHVSSVDFLFPHLENVRAVAQALAAKPPAQVWMICEQMRAPKEDEATVPLAETKPVRELIAEGYSGSELRHWLLSVSYRTPFQATWKSLRNAVQGHRRLQEVINRLHHVREKHEGHPELAEILFSLEQSFFAALSDDLNMPRALAALFRFVRELNPLLDANAISEAQSQSALETLQKLNTILGVFDLELKPLGPPDAELLRQREEARRRKDWSEADRLRIALRERGIRVLDSPHGPRWERIH